MNEPRPFPWREWLRLALGKMGMRAPDFWSLTLVEWLAACEGFREWHSNPDHVEPPTKAEAAEAWRKARAMQERLGLIESGGG